MKVAIHQPQYWPWPRYIHKVMSSDMFVYLDTVQFSKNGMQNRNRIKSVKGPQWLTVPVRHRFGQAICETGISDRGAVRKHLRTLEAAYGRTEGYRRWKEELRGILDCPTDSLCDIAIQSTEWILQKLQIGIPRVRASELSAIGGQGLELVVSICKVLGATRYLSGAGGVEYMRPVPFAEIGCQVWLQEWSELVYAQAHPEVGFVPDLSSVDLLLNCPDAARQLMEDAGGWTLLWGGP